MAVRKWGRRMEAEYRRRLKKEGCVHDKESPRCMELAESLKKEGPCRPKGQRYARFPKGWAKDPEDAKKKRVRTLKRKKDVRKN